MFTSRRKTVRFTLCAQDLAEVSDRASGSPSRLAFAPKDDIVDTNFFHFPKCIIYLVQLVRAV